MRRTRGFNNPREGCQHCSNMNIQTHLWHFANVNCIVMSGTVDLWPIETLSFCVKLNNLNYFWPNYCFNILLNSNVNLDRRSLSRFVSGHWVCWEFGSRVPGFESCIKQRETTCLLSIRKSLACARTSKVTTTNPLTSYFPCVWCCLTGLAFILIKKLIHV